MILFSNIPSHSLSSFGRFFLFFFGLRFSTLFFENNVIGVELALWYSMVFHLPLSSSPRIFLKFGFSVFHQSYQWVVIGSHHYLGINPKK
jgi:hypothetical protein